MLTTSCKAKMAEPETIIISVPDSSSSSKKSKKKNLNSYCFVNSFGLFIFENNVKSGSASGSEFGSASGYNSQRHGSADPDPDPHQYVMDPEH